jgi:hypothetical protein
MPWAFIQRIAIRKRELTTTRSTLMRHNLSYRCRLKSSNAEVATRATSLSTSRRPNLRCAVDQAMGAPAWTIFRFSFSLKANNPPMPSWRG